MFYQGTDAPLTVVMLQCARGEKETENKKGIIALLESRLDGQILALGSNKRYEGWKSFYAMPRVTGYEKVLLETLRPVIAYRKKYPPVTGDPARKHAREILERYRRVLERSRPTKWVSE